MMKERFYMKELLGILGAATLTVTPLATTLNTTKIELNNNFYDLINEDYQNNQKNSFSNNNVVENINLNLETWAIGKAWGVGEPNVWPIEDEVIIDLNQFGGKYLFQNRFEEMLIDIEGDYYFQKGKQMNWSNYYKEKKSYTASRVINWDIKEGLNRWIQLEYFESDKGGYKWGNYYKSELYVEFKDLDKLVIKIKYTIAAYGVGNNWYWSAGNLRAPKVTFITR